MPLHPRDLSARTWPDVAAIDKRTAIVLQPIGATEQHGRHLPLATDYLVAAHTAAQAVTAAGDELDLWLLPTLAYGKSTEHLDFPGTITLSTETLLAVLDDVGRSVARAGFRKLCFVNGHGGNSALLQVANREIRLRHGLMVFTLHPHLPPDQGNVAPTPPAEQGMSIHAGYAETSALLAIAPELVHMDRAVAGVPGWLAENQSVRFGGATSFGWTAADFSPDGVIGDPAGADAAVGEKDIASMVAGLVAALREVASFELREMPYTTS